MNYVLLAVSFALVLAGALLFTGAVEWIGHKLNLGVGAVGSILAAVGTAMPETLIAIVALISANEGSEDVAIGAIVIAILVANYVIQDGESTWFEGVQLLAVYIVFGLAFYFA